MTTMTKNLIAAAKYVLENAGATNRKFRTTEEFLHKYGVKDAAVFLRARGEEVPEAKAKAANQSPTAEITDKIELYREGDKITCYKCRKSKPAREFDTNQCGEDEKGWYVIQYADDLGYFMSWECNSCFHKADQANLRMLAEAGY